MINGRPSCDPKKIAGFSISDSRSKRGCAAGGSTNRDVFCGSRQPYYRQSPR